MKYLLDTNTIIQVLNWHEGVLARLTRLQPGDCGVSCIVMHELFYGAYKGARREQNLRRVEAMRFEVLEFDKEDARCAGEIRAELALGGSPIGPYDVLIAGQAACRGLVLVTHNMREFARVRGLMVEDWEGVTGQRDGFRDARPALNHPTTELAEEKFLLADGRARAL